MDERHAHCLTYHSEHVRNIGTNAGKKVAGSVHHEHRVFEQREVQHLVEDPCLLRAGFDEAKIVLLFYFRY